MRFAIITTNKNEEDRLKYKFNFVSDKHPSAEYGDETA